MTPALSTWVFFVRLFTYYFLKWHGYQLKSRLHRYFYDRQYANFEVATYGDLASLVGWIRQQKWVADGWSSLFDAVCSPNKVQAVGQGDHKIGDCDEFAIYLTAAIDASINAGRMRFDDRVSKVRFLTVTWVETETWLPGGHNVCLLYHPRSDGTVWYSFMDYGMPSPQLRTVDEIAALIRRSYAGWSGKGSQQAASEPAVWAIQTLDLTPEVVRWGGPTAP